MKKLTACLVLISVAGFAFAADESEIVLRARNDAAEDARQYNALWWGVGGVAVTVLPVIAVGFFADAISVDARRALALTVPVVGGTGLALVGYFTGTATAPEERIAAIEQEHDDPGLLSIYETEYAKARTRMQRRRRGNAALIGFGTAVGAMGAGFLVAYLSKQ